MRTCMYVYRCVDTYIYIYIYTYIYVDVGNGARLSSSRKRPEGSFIPPAHLTRSNSNARNAISSQSFFFQRKCLITSARESL